MSNANTSKASNSKSHSKGSVSYDAIVVGAGVIGATLALGLAQQKGWKVALLEKSVPVGEQQQANLRATALGLPSQKLLSDLDVWQMLDNENYCAYEHMFVWDENSDSELSFSSSDYGKDALGYIVDHFALQRQLQIQLKNQQPVASKGATIDCYYDAQIEEICQQDSGVQVSVKVDVSGEASEKVETDEVVTLSAQWLFAADGVDSQVRTMAHISMSQHDYQQDGVVAKIRTEHAHQHTAWQRYIDDGSIALLPLNNGECSIVWSVTKPQAAELLSLSDQKFVKRLESVLQSKLGTIELCSKRFSFPLRSVRAEQYLKNSVILLGDAAHGIHPMAGQGANLGFNDVAKILEEIADMPAQHSKMYRAFRRYERQQKLNNQTMDGFLTGLDSVFRTDNVLVHSLRRVGMKMINEQPLIKSMFANQVLGKH